MKTVARSSSQTMQRVKVGMSGLAAVVLLIGLASAIFSAANREQPVVAAGPAVVGLASNAIVVNAVDETNEPLADLGVAPSTENVVDPAAAKR